MRSNEWKLLPLEDCMEAIIDYRGKTPRKSSFGIPLITAKIVKGGRILEPTEFIPYEDYDERMSRGIPKAGDIVVTTEAPLGEVGQLDNRKLSVGQRLITLRGKSGLLDNTYLKFLMMSEFVQNQLLARATGTTVSGIKQAELRKIDLLIPPLPTQRRIADILSVLDEKIELNRQVNVTLEAMAQAIFREWFVDFNLPDVSDPKGLSRDHAPLQAMESGKNGSRRAGQTFRVSGIPQGWRVGKLGDIYKTASGGTPSRARNEYYANGTYQWVKSKELNGSFIIDTEEKITGDALKNSSTKLLPKHSVLIAMYGATVGEIGIISNEATTNQAVCAFIPNEDYPFSFIFQFLKNNKDDIISRAVGSAQQNISQELLRNLEVIIPESNILKKYHTIVEPIFLAIEENIKQTATLAAVRDALLPKLMSGEIETRP